MIMSVILSLSFIPSLAYPKDRIVILDTGYYSHNHEYDCSPNLNANFTNDSMLDDSPHGSIINSIITDHLNKDKYCIINVKYDTGHNFEPELRQKRYIEALQYVLSLRPKYLNLSISGKGEIPEELRLLTALINRGVKIFVASGNDEKDLDKECDIFPACYHLPLYVVGSNDTHGNYGKVVKYIESGIIEKNGRLFKGTSFSAPRLLRRMLDAN